MGRIEHEGNHDWLSAEYVARWVAEWSLRDDRLPQLRRVAMGLPFPRDERVRVLDLGSGWGPLAEGVLAYRPQATVTLVDVSPPMLEHARTRLNAYQDRTRYEQRDFAHAGWIDGLGGPFDAAVSGLAVHNLEEPAQIARVYADVAGLLRPGGCYLNLEILSPAGPQMTAIDRRLQADEQGSDPDAAMATELSPGGPPLSLADQLEWLRSAGFAEVDCLWRHGSMALLCGVA
jgi:tRNA (cmo5U34)-methyltransferase